MGSLITMNHNVLTAIDVETTGTDSLKDEVVQLAAVVLDHNLDPTTHFMTYVRPELTSAAAAAQVHGIPTDVLDSAPSRWEAGEQMFDWFQSLGLAPGKRLTPLCHNSQFDITLVKRLLGGDQFDEMIGYPTRDTMSVAVGINDRAAFEGRLIPFASVGLKALCNRLGVPLDDAHDALADALATGRLYKALLTTTF